MSAEEAAAGSERADTLAALGGVPEAAAALVAELDEMRLRHRHAPALPSVEEVVGHLWESATRLDGLVGQVVGAGRVEVDLREALDAIPPPERTVPTESALRDLERVRRHTLETLRAVPEEGWAAPLLDRRLGELTLTVMADMACRHELAHLTQIRGLLVLLPDS